MRERLDPPEPKAGHFEYDQDDFGCTIRYYVLDYDDDGNRLQGGDSGVNAD